MSKVSVNYYTLRSALIFPETATLGIAGTQNKQINISGLIPAIHIQESITNTMMSGHLEVIDSTGLLEKYPLRGEERLTLEIEDSIKNVRIWDFFVYRIDTVDVSDMNTVIKYKMHFISYQSFLAMNKTITRPFREKTVSQIVSEVFRDTFTPKEAGFLTYKKPSDRNKIKIFDNTKKDLVVENTDGFVRLVIPRMNAHETMNFLQRRAYSINSPSSSFRFFESADAFHFVSDEFLFKRAENEDRIYDFTFYDKIERDGSDFFTEVNNLESLVNQHRVDTLDDIHGGVYRNRVLELDTIRRRALLKEPGYDYFQFRKNYHMNISGDDVLDRHERIFMERYSRPDNAKSFIVVKDFDDFEDVAAFQLRGQQHYKDIVENRLPFRKHLESITVNAVGSPRLDITVGDLINLDILEFSGDTTGRTVKNPQLSGRYLVKSLLRDLVKEEGRNSYTLIKMNWSRDRKTNRVVKEYNGGSE